MKAATEGRVLVLEGIEKAERNVLPVLNNLLENREMQLDDGRFLMAADRYDKLLQVRLFNTVIPGTLDLVHCSLTYYIDIYMMILVHASLDPFQFIQVITYSVALETTNH